MSISSADVVRVAPEFSTESSDTFAFFIAEAARYINRTVWGAKADYAQALLTAHFMKSRGSSGGSGAPAGPIQSEKVGDISTTYATPVVSGTSFSTTAYGQQFEQIKRTIVVSPFVSGAA